MNCYHLVLPYTYGLKNTEDTISAGQVNCARGVETSWLAPEEIPSNKPGPCVLHLPSAETAADQERNHVIWEGVHRVLVPQVVANTPEVKDDQEFFDVVGPVCATAGCRCGIRKLSDALCERFLPAVAAVAAEPAVVEAEEANPQPVVPPAADLDGDAVEADRLPC